MTATLSRPPIDGRLAVVAAFAAGGAAIASLLLLGNITAWIVPINAAALALLGGSALLGRRPLATLAALSMPVALSLSSTLVIVLAREQDPHTPWARFLADNVDWRAAGLATLPLGAALIVLLVIPVLVAHRARTEPAHDGVDRTLTAISIWLGVVGGSTSIAGAALSDRLARGGITWLSHGFVLSLGAMAAGAALHRRVGRMRFLLAGFLVAESAGAVALAIALVTHARPLTHVVGATLDGAQFYEYGPYACALLRDGRVLCWGDNSMGQLGDGTTQDRTSPVAVEGVEDAVEIGIRGGSTCARCRDGEVLCWGGRKGESGSAEPKSLLLRPERQTSLAPVRRLVQHGCVVTRADDLVCWTGSAWNTVASAKNALDFAVTARGGCVRRAEGVECWGTMPKCHPEGPEARSTGHIVMNHGMLCEVTAQKRVRCWFEPPRGMDRCPEPRELPGVEGVERVAFASLSTCGIDAGAVLRCWDEQGNGGEPLLRDVVAIESNDHDRFCAVRADGTLWCWGSLNQDGELGDGTRRASAIPVLVRR